MDTKALLKQMQKWHEQDEHQKIVDALEAIPEEERTAEIDMELARAYNNLGDPDTPEGRGMLKDALVLMMRHEDELKDTYSWNFRIGYAYFYLDQQGRALPYFRKALELHPGDRPFFNTRLEIKDFFIRQCEETLTFPRFQKCFRERTEAAWKAFAETEAEIRRIMDEDKSHERGEELSQKIQSILNLAFYEVSFEFGFNGEKYELILTPEGNRVALFPFLYFREHAPEAVLKYWNILVGRSPSRDLILRSFGYDISGDDVQLWLEEVKENSFALFAYCEKLRPLLETDEGKVWWMITTLIDQILGEIPHMRYVDSFEVLDEPRKEPGILLSKLPEEFKKQGLDVSLDPKSFLENGFVSYRMNPDETSETQWRGDVIAGSSNCLAIISEYMGAETDFVGDLFADGAVAGSIYYPLETLREDDGSQKIFDFRDRLESMLLTDAGNDAITLTGGATGLHYGYIDFIAWDIVPVLDAARSFFKDSDLPWAAFHAFHRDAEDLQIFEDEEDETNEAHSKSRDPLDSPDDDAGSSAPMKVYSSKEMDVIQEHIEKYFGKFEYIFHELVSPDVHIDICLIPPSEGRNYYTLVTMGMGSYKMNVPKEYAEYKLERAELAISLPSDWKFSQEDFKDERWYWPIRLLKILARYPLDGDTWLGYGHSLDFRRSFAPNTQFCASLLVAPLDVDENGQICVLPNGEEVNFYQVLPLYRNEMKYKVEYGLEALLGRMSKKYGIVCPNRPNIIAEGIKIPTDFDGEMDNAAYHLESIEEKLPEIDPINAYNHMAIYLRWCMEQDLMHESFLKEHKDLVESVKADPSRVDLRLFIRDNLEGRLFLSLFNQKGRTFAGYYYGNNFAPCYPSDVDDYALKFFGPARYHSNEFKQEAYLFIPFDEDYYQDMAKLIDKRFLNWLQQKIDEETLNPSDLAHAMMTYLDCDCTYFPSMKDDDPIVAAYGYARRLGVREGFIPVLVQVDEALWTSMLLNSNHSDEETEGYTFDLEKVEGYRKTMLATPIASAKELLEALTDQRKSEAEEDEIDLEKDLVGEMEGGTSVDRLQSFWNPRNDMTYPLILARIPVKNPWEIFAYLPFGNWNECPDTPQLMAVAKYWFEQYGAVPAAISHDVLEFDLPAPVPKENAMELAMQQYAFCPDQVQSWDTIGALADSLRQSIVWYFWWD